MTYDYIVEVHINRDGMARPWHRNWRWRWDCRGEGRHEDTPAFFLTGVLPAAYGYQTVLRLNVCMPLSTTSSVRML